MVDEPLLAVQVDHRVSPRAADQFGGDGLGRRRRLAAHIAAHTPDREGLVFTSPLGKPLRHSNFRQTVWLPATKAAGLDGLTPHDLRHTCASLLVSVGAHPRAVMAQLGHATIAVTMNVYAHLFPSDQDELAARLDARRARSLTGEDPIRH